MPVETAWGDTPQSSPPPVRVSRRPKKRTDAKPLDVPAGSGLDGPPVQSVAPAQLPPRTQALNDSFGGANNAPMPEAFTADLPDPPIVGLTDGTQAPATPKIGPRPTYPQSTPVSSQIAGAPTPRYDSEPAAEALQGATEPTRESDTDRMVREARDRLSSANAEQPKKRHGFGGRALSALESFVIGAGRPFQEHMPQNGRELAYGLSQGAATAAYGAVKSDYPSRVRIQNKRELYGQQYDRAVQRQSKETQNRLQAANADYAEGKGAREDLKLTLKAQYDAWKQKNGDARLDETANYHRFLTEERIAGRLSTEQYHDALIAESQANRKEKGREFDVNAEHWQKTYDATERQRKIQNRQKEAELEIRRTVAARGGGESDVKKQVAAADVDIYEGEADDIQQGIDELNAIDEGERGSSWRVNLTNLKGQLRVAKRKADESRAKAGQQTEVSKLSAIESEDEVRNQARTAGVNEDAAVARWKRLRARNQK